MSLLWKTATEGDYHQGVFYLPTEMIEHYDEPTEDSVGDDGWSKYRLREDVRKNGIKKPIAVGMSVTDLNQTGDDTPCAFNGNHRLAIAKELGIPHVPCVHSLVEDSEPLTRGHVEDLGGWGD